MKRGGEHLAIKHERPVMHIVLSPSHPGAVSFVPAKKTNRPLAMIKTGLGIALSAALMGCVGYVDGGYVGAVVVPEPEVFLFGGGYERGRDAHVYSHRGAESRAVAHPGRGGARPGRR